MSAKSIAEALAAAERETPRIGSPEIFRVLFDSGNVHWADDVPDSLTSGVGDEESCVHVRSDFVNAALTHLAAQIDILTKRSAALGAVYEIAAASDPADAAWAYVFTLAHDGMQTCAGCFGEGRAPLPLVPARAVWMAEQRAKQAEAQLEAVSFQGWSACVQLLALQQEREEPKP